MRIPDPHIILPGGYRAESGLYLPSELPAIPGTVGVPPELVQEPALVVVAQPPSFVDQVWVFATQEELGFDPTPLETILQVAHEIPFWPAMKILARFQRDLWPVRTDQEGQLALARRFLGENSSYERQARTFLAGGNRRTLFSEQQLFAIQKLLLMYGKESDPEQELANDEYIGLMVALTAIPGSLLGPQAEEIAEAEQRGVSDETWMRLFVGHGGFIGRGSIKHELARVHLLYVLAANGESAREHGDYCPIDEWVMGRFGLSFLELQAAGFSLWAGSHMGDVEETPVLLDSSYFAPTALAERAVLALDALSAGREWYQEHFLRTEGDLRRLGFEITPMLQRPALRFDDGRVMPLAPRALEGWLGATGAYYRLFDLAIELGASTREKFTRFNGYLIEQHVLTAAQLAHPPSAAGAIWVPKAIGEQLQRTRVGESRTPDVSLDYGQDLILIEVTGGRPTEKSIVDADLEAIQKDIEKLLEVKIRQLGKRVEDLRAGTLTLPDVRMADVQRIWPVVVNSEGLLQTPSLWQYLRDAGAVAALDQPGVQPLTLLDLEDVERLMGLAVESHRLIDILVSKTQGGWAEREFSSWFQVEGLAYGAGESAFIDEASSSSFQALIDVLRGDQTMEEYEARVETVRALARRVQ